MAKATLKSTEKVDSQEFESQVKALRDYGATDIVIAPNFDPNIPNMGLEKYGQVFFEGTGMMQSLRSTEVNGVTRYVTGLDEFADNVKRLPESQRLAKAKAIRQTVSELEYELFANRVEPDDPEFWAKVTLAPTKPDYWSNVAISIGNQGLTLDVKKASDLLILIAAESGGFDDIAPSKEAAAGMVKAPKFYVERRRDTRINQGKLKESRDNAIYELFKIKMEAPQDLFYIAKNVLPISNSYKLKDRAEIIYSDLSDYIEGISIETDKKKAPIKFLEYAKKDKQYLTVRAYVLEGIFLRHILSKGDKIYIKDTNIVLGNTLDDCIEYLLQPQNQEDLNIVQDIIETEWNK